MSTHMMSCVKQKRHFTYSWHCTNVEINTNIPIRYAIEVEPGGESILRKVVLFCSLNIVGI